MLDGLSRYVKPGGNVCLVLDGSRADLLVLQCTCIIIQNVRSDYDAPHIDHLHEIMRTSVQIKNFN